MERYNESVTTVSIPEKKSPQEQNSYNKRLYSLNAILNQEIQFVDDNDDRTLNHLSIDDLNNKLKLYYKLFKENKINTCNAFQIDIVDYVQEVVKKTDVPDFLEMSYLFEVINKVYSCRVEEFWTSGNKMINSFLMEKSKKNNTELENNEDKIKPRKKLKLTTNDKLCHKENQMYKKNIHLSVYLDNDINDYVNPSRIMLNKFSDVSYWPEYNWSRDNNINTDQGEKYEMEDISHAIENGKICTYYHEFVAECDKKSKDDDLNKLDNIITHFNGETLAHKDDITVADNSQEHNLSMNIDLNNQNTEIISHASSSSLSNDKNISINRQENLDSISQILPLVNTNDSDYSFFDPNQIHHLKCPSHWKDKFEQMTMTNKEKRRRINSPEGNHNQTHSKTNSSIASNSKSENNQYKVDFSTNMSGKLKALKRKTGRNKCSYQSWKPHDNINLDSNKLKLSLTKTLEMCKYMNVCPEWYKNKSAELNNVTNENSPSLSSELNVSYGNGDILHVETTENHSSDNDRNEAVIINDNNLILQDCYNIEDDDTYEGIEIFSYFPGYIDMHKLKKYILNIIKPDGNIVLSITFEDLLLQLPEILPENMKNNLHVAVIYVALLHLANEHNLHLETNGNEIKISQG